MSNVRERLERLLPLAGSVERPQAGRHRRRWDIDKRVEGKSLLGINTNQDIVEVAEIRHQSIIYKFTHKRNRPDNSAWAKSPPYRPPILALNGDCGPRDEKDLLDSLIRNAVESEEPPLSVKIGNCRCKSVWCPGCLRLYYVPRYKAFINLFDYRRTRQVILSPDRKKFSSALEALEAITEQKSISAFVRKIRKGRKIKNGNQWEYKYDPVSITRVMSVLEFYEDGYPHWHLLIEVEKEGRSGMLGGKRLHWAWPHGIVKETYFRNLRHWNNIAGYFAEKGYFEKGKKYQTELPEEIRKNLQRRVRRMVFYPCHEKAAHIEVRPEVTEEEAYQEVAEFFDQVAQGTAEEVPRKVEDTVKKPFSYDAILGSCGQKTYIQADMEGHRLGMVVQMPFEALKLLYKPVYVEGRGYLCQMSMQSLAMLERVSVWVRWVRIFDEIVAEETTQEPFAGGVH